MNRALLRFLIIALVMSCVLLPTGDASSRRPTVLVARVTPEELSRLQKSVPEADLVAVADAEDAQKRVADADALVGVLNEDLVSLGRRLKWVHVYSAGVDRYRFENLVESEIVFTNSKVIQGPNVADQAMALLLALSRGIHVAVREQSAHDWRGTREKLRAPKNRPIELEGKRALVVGFGGIGSAIGRRAFGFGMEVVGIRRDTSHKPDFVAELHSPAALDAQLALADVVFVAVPLTDATTGMFGAKQFSKMKEDAIFINIARGKVVQTDALVAALTDGGLRGAGLDVTEPEPLPPEHPLWELPNVVISPHMGGTSDRVWERRLALVERNLRHFVEGEPLENIVDKRAGY